jgi:hypothetical protein
MSSTEDDTLLVTFQMAGCALLKGTLTERNMDNAAMTLLDLL